MEQEKFVDSDVEEIANSENETNLITKFNNPLNVLLLTLIIMVTIAIVIVNLVL